MRHLQANLSLLAQHSRAAEDGVAVNLPRRGVMDETDPEGEAGTGVVDGGTHRRCILVVDDERMVRRLICRILEDAGYDVREAPDGREAMGHILAHAPSLALVISDVVMPLASGHDLAAFLQRNYPALPLLLISAYSPEEVHDRYGLPAPWAPLLRKPFTAAELVRAVGTACAGGGLPPSAGGTDA
ncbi:MAG TPA: response regulator [Gemmatimonadales bacterium]|nr:response regulator [Gemmatimonadales bacterium]